jgi:hypothetical protein
MNKSFSKIRHIQESNRMLEKRLMKEQSTPNTNQSFDSNYFKQNPKGTIKIDNYAIPEIINGVEVSNYDAQFKKFWSAGDGLGRGWRGGDCTYEYKIENTMRSPDGEEVINVKNPEGTTASYVKNMG